jgi:hypothetical protein
MMENYIVLGTLSFLLVVSNIFWAAHSQRLVNKLMSRDYFEYKSSLVHKKHKRAEKKEDIGPVEDLGPLHEVLF